MITVDIQVPIIGKTYDFSVDENTPVETINEEVVDLIIQKEACGVGGSLEMHLFFYDKRTILDHSKTLRGNGVGNGDKLILV